MGIRKSIQPLKLGDELVVWLHVWSEVQIFLHVVQLMPLYPQTPSFLAAFKSRLVLPVWYQLTQVVMEKRPFKRVSCRRRATAK